MARPRATRPGRSSWDGVVSGTGSPQQLDELSASGDPLTVDRLRGVAEHLEHGNAPDRAQRRRPAAALLAVAWELVAEDRRGGLVHGLRRGALLGGDDRVQLGIVAG